MGKRLVIKDAYFDNVSVGAHFYPIYESDYISEANTTVGASPVYPGIKVQKSLRGKKIYEFAFIPATSGTMSLLSCYGDSPNKEYNVIETFNVEEGDINQLTKFTLGIPYDVSDNEWIGMRASNDSCMFRYLNTNDEQKGDTMWYPFGQGMGFSDTGDLLMCFYGYYQ